MPKQSAARKMGPAAGPGTAPEALIALKGLDYEVDAAEVFARVKCIQTYENRVEKSLEAVYVFPLPDEASVTACSLRIGKKKVTAELKPRQEAQREYDDAVDRGHHAALMEQERANVFTMNVGGIEPGEKIKVTVEYIQRVPWQDGGRRLTVPLVVAPRFIPGHPVGKQAGGWSDDTDEVPDASRITPVVAKHGASYRASITVRLASTVKTILASPSHPYAVAEPTLQPDQQCRLQLRRLAPDRDFILTWRSTSREPAVTVYTNSSKGESFILANILPPAKAATEPAEIIFLLDVSGSMSGPKLEGLKTVTRKILTSIKDRKLGHRAGVILFETEPHILATPGEVTDALIAKISSITVMGGTMLGPALSLAYTQFTGSNRPYYIVVITDGETESLTCHGRGARIIAVGMDSALNDSALRDLARKSGGACEWFYPEDDFDRGANAVLGLLSGPVVTDLQVEGPGEAVGVQDVFEGRPASIAIRYSGPLPETVKISGDRPDGRRRTWTITPGEGRDCPFLPRLWAREAIRQEADPDRQEAASLKYGVLCSRTAFVAVHEKTTPGDKPLKVEVPVCLPAGWNYGAVFGSDGMGALGGGEILFSLDPAPSEPDEESYMEYSSMESARRAYENGEYQTALELIEKDLALDPERVESLVLLALIQRRLDNLTAAIEALDLAIALDPNHAIAYYNRACYRVLSQAPLQESMKDLQTAISLKAAFRDFAKTDPDFDSVRDRPEFKQIIGA